MASREPHKEQLDDARALIGAFLEGPIAYRDALVRMVGDQLDATARWQRMGDLCVGVAAIASMYIRREAEAAGVTPAEALHKLARAVADFDAGQDHKG